MDNKQFEMMLSDAEVRLDRLKALYEQWFQGIERLEPLIPKKNLERQISLLRREKPRNTRLRFRFQVLIQRYTTYMTYWQRVSRQIEEGSYRRDILRVRKQREAARLEREKEAKRKREKRLSGGIAKSKPPGEKDIKDSLWEEELSDALSKEAPHLSQSTSSQPPAVRSISPFAQPSIPSPALPSSAAGNPHSATSSKPPIQIMLKDRPLEPSTKRSYNTSSKDMAASLGSPQVPRRQSYSIDDEISDQQIRRVYDQYLYARMKNKERTDNIKIEKLAQSMRKIVPQLKKKHKGRSIDFQVVIKNGKVALKPVLR